MERSVSMPLGVLVERRESKHRWQQHSWRPVAVIPGAPPVGEWREVMRGCGYIRWHAATLRLELHRKETEGYRYNLSGKLPAIYVGLRRETGTAHEVRPFLVTASPYEAASFPDDIVEPVPMPEGLIAWVQDFVNRHHVDEPFRKRKRDGRKSGEDGAGGGPVRDPRSRTDHG